jgi:hypothetical protein
MPAPAAAPIPAPVPVEREPGDDWDSGALEGGRVAAPSPVAAWGHGGRSPFHADPRPNRKRRRWPWLLLAPVVIGAAAAYALIRGGGDSSGEPAAPSSSEIQAPAGEAAPAEPAPETVPATAAPADPASTATSSDLAVSVSQVVDPWESGNAVEIPAPGNRYVAVEATLMNTSDGEVSFATLTGIDVQDSTGQAWAVAYAGFDLPGLDGQLSPGESRTGWAVFEVAADRTGLVLRVRGSIIAPPATFPL